VKHAGYYATRALRVEKFYAFWGQDLDTFTTPLECGRSWRVKFDVNVILKTNILRQLSYYSIGIKLFTLGRKELISSVETLF
jgi:glycine cleavage system aminomethyltransferase T